MMMQAGGDPNTSKMSRMTRLGDIPLSYQETRGKRGVAVPYDECRRQIQEQNELSPARNRESSSPVDEIYRSMTGRALADSRSTPYLQISTGDQTAGNGMGLMAHLNSHREIVRNESEKHLNRPSTTKNKKTTI